MTYNQITDLNEGTITVDSKDMIFNFTADFDFIIQRSGSDVFRYDYGNDNFVFDKDVCIYSSNELRWYNDDETKYYSAGYNDTNDELDFIYDGTVSMNFDFTGGTHTAAVINGLYEVGSGFGLVLAAERVNPRPYIRLLSTEIGSAIAVYIDVPTGKSFQIWENNSVFFSIDKSYTEFRSDSVGGTAWKLHWPAATTTTSNLVVHEIDAVTNLTMGVNFGVTGWKINVKAPNGVGTSYIIDGYQDSVSKWNVQSDGVMNFVNGVQIDPHVATANVCKVYFGDTAGDDGYVYANSSDTYPYMKMFGGSTVEFQLAGNQPFYVRDTGVARLSIVSNGSGMSTSVTSTIAWLFGVDTVTTGTGVKVQAGGLTEGDAFAIYVDSDIVTTGKAFNIYSGSSMDISIFSVDEDGDTIISGSSITLNGTGNTTITTASVLGVARAINFDIPVGAGGAGAARLGYSFAIDGTEEAALIAETTGGGGYQEPVFRIPYYSADYGAGWAAPPNPTPTGLVDGCMFIAYNSNGGEQNSLFYIRSNGAWVPTGLPV